jgi:hypothetical protein
MMKSKEIESLMILSNQSESSFNIIVNNIVNFFDNNNDDNVIKQKVLNCLKGNNIDLQRINNLLLNNPNNSNSIFLLGKFNDLGIGTDIDKKKYLNYIKKQQI